MKQRDIAAGKWLVLSLILFVLGWHLFLPIDLTRIDLGRHIKNGELLLQGTWEILYKNYYSYTHPEYPFINHHWFFGIVCYFLRDLAGFTGISLFFIAVRLATFGIFFRIAERFSSFSAACAFGLLSFPFIATRIDIRPELFSTLFCGLFWWLIDSYRRGLLTYRRLIVWLVILQILWVNTHIFFIMGPVLTLLLWLQARKEEGKPRADLSKAFWLVAAACLINPSGWKGALLPLTLFKGFHFPLVENQSMFIAHEILPRPLWAYFFVCWGALIAAWIFLLRSRGIKNNLGILLLTVFIAISSLTAIRIMPVFGHFWIPLAAYAFAGWLPGWPAIRRRIFLFVLISIGIIAALTAGQDRRPKIGLGLLPGTDTAARFFKHEGIQGPIFNDYKIGGYLIYHLSPEHKFFVDNRGEAFPKAFFDEELIPALKSEESWRKLDGKYDFNVIFFHRRNPFERDFLIKRWQDPAWAPVFADENVIIFLRRNAQNAGIIRRYEMH